MAANDTRTRADDLRTFTELDALSTVLANVLSHVSVGDDGDPDDIKTPAEMFSSSWDWPGYRVSVVGGPTQDDLERQLWEFGTDGPEDDPEWQQTRTRSTLLAARLLFWLASDEGRTVLEAEGHKLLAVASARQ